MKKTLIRILSVLICLSMINLPVLGVSADKVEITEDFSNYTSESDFVLEWGVNKTSTTSTPGLSDGSYNIIQTGSIPYQADGTTRNGVLAPEVYAKFNYEKVDAENKTVTKAVKLQGVYDITLDVEYNPLTSLAAYYNITVGDLGDGTSFTDKLKNTGVMVRLAKGNIAIFNAKSAAANSMSVATHSKSTDGNNTVKFTVDTINDNVKVVINGDTDNISEGSTMYPLDAVSGFVIQNMERFDVGSFVKVKKVTVKELESEAGNATHAVLDSLPAKLAEDVDNVTEDLVLPEVTGITWKSSDTSVISNSGAVTRGTEDKEVKMTATVDLGNGGGAYTKEYTMTVPKAETPVIPDVPEEPEEPEVPDASLYNVVIDYTKLNDITEIQDISTTLGTYADVKVTKGKGLEIIQTNSLPVVNGSSNTNKSPSMYLGFQGVVDEDKQNNTQRRISKFGGKLRIDIDMAVKCDSYSAPVDGVTVSTPFYEMMYGYSPSLGSETYTTFAHIYFRLRTASATVLNTTKAADNSMSPNTIYYEKEVDHKISTVVDTYSKEAVTDIDGTQSKGEAQLSSYFNALWLTGMDRMKVGSYLNIKKVEISLLEANDDYNNVVAKIDSLPASLVADPNAVTENIVLPEIADVKWTTSDSEICDEFGNINRWYSDRKVTLTATYGTGHTVMHKDYILNIKAMDNVASREVSSVSGEEISNLIVSGDKVACEYKVDENGLNVVKTVGNAGEYSVKYPLFGDVIPYSAVTNSSLSMTGYSGIYDVSFSLTPNVSDDKPVYVNIDNDDVSAFGLEVANNKISLNCENGENIALVKEDTKGKTYDITLRADTENCKVWVFVNGELKTPSIQFFKNPVSYFVSLLDVVIPEECGENDGVSVNNITVTEYVGNEIEIKSGLKNALDKITFTDVADSATNTQSLKKLKENTDGYEIKWSSNSNLVDVESGNIYHGNEDETVIVSAVISKDGIYAKKDFYLNVVAAGSLDEQLEYYISDLPQTITSQPADAIQYDINLPSKHNGLDITWTSSHPYVIGQNGVLNTSATITEPLKVTLTANISINGTTVPKEYEYTVLPFSGEYTVYSGRELPSSLAVNGTENIRVTDNVTATVNFSQNGAVNNTVIIKDSNGKAAVKIVVNNNEYYVIYGNGTTEKYPMAANTSKELKVVLLPEVSKVAVWDGDVRIADYVDTVSEICDFAGFEVVGDDIAVNNTSVKTDLYGMLGINLSNVDYFAPFAKGVVKESKALVNENVIPCNVSWKSSDASLMADNGTVTVPDTYKFVTMTLTLSVNGNEDVKLSVPVTFAVACDKAKNILAGSDAKATTMDKPGFPIVYATDNDVNTVYGVSNVAKKPVVSFDMGSVKYVNSIYLSEDVSNAGEGLKSYVLSYSKDGESWNVIKTGTVTKPQDYLIAFGNVEARYLKLEITDAYTKDIYFNEIEAYLFGTSGDLVQLELDLIDLGVESTVTSDLELPKVGAFGTSLVWSTNNAEIISADGKVTRPEKGTTVKLTVKAVCDGEEYTRDFALYVSGKKAAGGSAGGGGGAAGGVGGTGTSTVPGFAVTDVPKAEEEVTVTPEENVFADMDENHWAYENVKKLKELGIVNGDEKGNFNPSSNVTREQFLKMLVEVLGITPVYSKTSFADVDGNAWYASYVSAGTDAGIINGITSETFGVGSEISRQDMAVMILRVLNMKNVETSVSDSGFKDDTSISDYAKDAVYTVRSAGIIEGYEGMFNPKNSLTRAEAATVIIKLLDLLK